MIGSFQFHLPPKNPLTFSGMRWRVVWQNEDKFNVNIEVEEKMSLELKPSHKKAFHSERGDLYGGLFSMLCSGMTSSSPRTRRWPSLLKGLMLYKFQICILFFLGGLPIVEDHSSFIFVCLQPEASDIVFRCDTRSGGNPPRHVFSGIYFETPKTISQKYLWSTQKKPKCVFTTPKQFGSKMSSRNQK